MNDQDEEDFVFACLLGAYIQSLRQQEEGQQQLQRMPECSSQEEGEEGG